MTCCSGSGEILVVPQTGGPGGHNAEATESEPPLPQRVASSWEEFFGFAGEDDATENMRRRMHNLRSRPYVAAVPEDEVEDELRRLRRDPRVAAATRNWRVSLASPMTGLEGVHVHAGEVFHFLKRAGILEGWHDSGSGAPVRIGILDSGIDPSGACCDVLDPTQIDAVALGSALRTNPHDPHGHGSVVAEIVHWLAPAARITSVRCFGRGAAALSDIVYGLLFARLLDEPIDVFNMSFSVDFSVSACSNCGFTLNTYDERHALRNLFEHLRTELDDRPLLVAAAGNEGGVVAVPASLAGVIAVGSTGSSPTTSPAPEPSYRELPCDFILAPGGTKAAPVASARRLYSGSQFFGTSFASAVVTGTIARMLADFESHGIPPGRDEGRRAAVVEALRHLARKDFEGYNPHIHGMGVLGGGAGLSGGGEVLRW